MPAQFSINSNAQTDMIDITSQIQYELTKTNIKSGILIACVPHTTAGITINEGADPDVQRDMLMELNKIVPFDDGYRHGEGNSAAHIKTTMVGSSVQLPVENGKIMTGTWQSIFLCEFDGPRNRRVTVQVVGK